MAVSSRRPHHYETRRRVLAAACLAIVLAVLGVGAAIYGPGWVGVVQSYTDPERLALRAALRAPTMADLRSGYAARHYKPIWLIHGRARPEANDFLTRLKTSEQDGLDPERYESDRLATMLTALPYGSRDDRAGTEVLLSRAFANYVVDLHTPVTGAEMTYTDPHLFPDRPPPQLVVERLARDRSLKRAIARATQMNPLYLQYRGALRSAAASGAEPETIRLLRLNLERLRALPSNPGRRFALVDSASGRLWLYENGKAVDSMKVIVGTPQEQTPIMAGLIRYAVFNPSWNVPPDLTRKTYAPRMRADPSTLASLGMDAWTDHTRTAKKLNPALVNWGAVAHGATSVWLRQRPGPHNAMGAVKFMLPNELGIYLHDTPNKALFEQDQRHFSAGCIRVEDYKRFSRWLYQGDVGPKVSGPDQRIDLRRPVPVYITYLTAAPENGTIIIRPDVYQRDEILSAQLRKDERRVAPLGERAGRMGLRPLTAASGALM